MNDDGFNDGLTASEVADAIIDIYRNHSADSSQPGKAHSNAKTRRKIEEKLEELAVSDELHGVCIHELPRHSQERTKAAQKNARRSTFGEFTTKG